MACSGAATRSSGSLELAYMILGRQGKNNPKLRFAGFRRQSGLYILYRN